MSHPVIQVLGDVLQLSSAQGLLHALRLEPRRTILSRALSSFKVLGTGIAIGRGIDLYGETILDYANRELKRRRPRRLGAVGWLAVGAGLGVGAAILFVPELGTSLWRGRKSQSSSPSSSASAPVTGATAAGVGAAPINGATG